MSAYRTRSASKQKRNPLEDVNALDGATANGRKQRRSSSSSSARKKATAKEHLTGENSALHDTSAASAATVGSAQMAELQNFSELNSSTMSTDSAEGSGAGGDHTASLGDLAKLMQSPADDDEVQKVNRRRQTADPDAINQLNAMFESSDDDDDDGEGDNADTAPTDSSTFSSPVPNKAMPTPKPLKSCISARKKSNRSGRASVRKGVHFGSPDAAEFHKDMATSSVTPLPKAYSRQRYHMASPETQAQAAREEAAENDRILAEASAEEEEVSVSSKLSSSARRQSMNRKTKGKGTPRSAAEEKKSLKKLRRSPRGDNTTNNSTASDFEDELRALAPLPSPMDARRRSTMPNLKILDTVDANYAQSDNDDDDDADVDYSQNFEEMSMDASRSDETDTTSRRLSMSSAASSPGDASRMSEASGADLTVPLQTLNDLVQRTAAQQKSASEGSDGNGNVDGEESVEYSQDFESTFGSPGAKDDEEEEEEEDHTVDLPKLQSLIAKSAATNAPAAAAAAVVAGKYPQSPSLAHLAQFAKKPSSSNGDDSSVMNASVATTGADENTVELAPLQALIQSAAATTAAPTTGTPAASGTAGSASDEDDDDDADVSATGADEHTVPLGTLADLVKKAAPATPSTDRGNGVSVSYPTDSPYPGDQSSLFTPATTPGRSDDASVEPVSVTGFVDAMGVNFSAPGTTSTGLPAVDTLSAEALKAWTPALDFLTTRLVAEVEEVQQLVQDMESDLSGTNPPMLREFGSMGEQPSDELKSKVATLLAASQAEAELEWLESYQKSLHSQVAQGETAVAEDIAVEATEYQQLVWEIDGFLGNGSSGNNTTSASSASDQVSQNSAVEKEQVELIRAYEQQISGLNQQLADIAAATQAAQCSANDEVESQAAKSAAAFAAAAAAAASGAASSRPADESLQDQDFVTVYKELQRVCGWQLVASSPCSGTDCINGTAHRFAYAAASGRVLRRAALPQLEVRVAASGAVATIQFASPSPAQPLAAFWHRACPALRPLGCTMASVADHVTTFDLTCARVAMILEEVADLQTNVHQSGGSLVRWAGGVASMPSMRLLMRFSTNPGFRGPPSQFQVVFNLGDDAANAKSNLSNHCDIKCIFGSISEDTVVKAIRDACDEQAYSFGALTRIHESLHMLVARSRC